jgi:hypothetical protein
METKRTKSVPHVAPGMGDPARCAERYVAELFTAKAALMRLTAAIEAAAKAPASWCGVSELGALNSALREAIGDAALRSGVKS